MREIWTRLRLRWRTLWKRRQLDLDLEDELAFHLAMRGEGARRAFGNVELVKEDLRDQWTFRAIENLWRDLRYAVRMLRRSPGFTLVAILSLAIGIGGNTAIFSVVDAILLKSLPVRDPEQLRVVLWAGEKGAPTNFTQAYSTRGSSGARGFQLVSISHIPAICGSSATVFGSHGIRLVRRHDKCWSSKPWCRRRAGEWEFLHRPRCGCTRRANYRAGRRPRECGTGGSGQLSLLGAALGH